MAEGGYQPRIFNNNTRKFNGVCRYFLRGVCNRGNACLYLHETPRQDEAQYVTQNSSHGGCACGRGCRDLCPWNSFDTCPITEHCLHGIICEVCKMPRRNPTDQNQRRRHHRECLAVHQRQSQDKECGICLENVMEIEGLEPERRFGILENCNHSFCIRCIEQWRLTLDETLVRHRTCPMCRSHSDLMMPCQYWIKCPDEKKQRMYDYYYDQLSQKLGL